MRRAADPRHATALQWFFKAGPGEYGAGDRFLGLRVPAVRVLALRYERLSLAQIRQLLASEWHEARMLALLVLVRRYRDGGTEQRDRIFRFYLRNTARINNWDLVDSSAPCIAGPHLLADRAALLALARSPSVWERRIARCSPRSTESIKGSSARPSEWPGCSATIPTT